MCRTHAESVVTDPNEAKLSPTFQNNLSNLPQYFNKMTRFTIAFLEALTTSGYAAMTFKKREKAMMMPNVLAPAVLKAKRTAVFFGK